jgi:two-component system phosphate regulon sensor histidine kinase PhoR
VAALVMGLGGAALALLLTRPLEAALARLEGALRAAALGNLDQRLSLDGPPETDGLTVAFNTLTGGVRGQLGALSAERDRLTASLAASANAVFAVDHDGVVRYLNPAAVALTGPVEGRGFAEAFRNHELSGLVRTALADGLRTTAPLALGPRESGGGGRPPTGVIRRNRARITPDTAVAEAGDGRWFQATASPITGGGDWAVLLVLQDITDARRVEATRRDFIANVSHELRTPLAGIKAVVETLRDGALDDSEAAGEFLGRVDAEVDRLIHLVEELLQLARIESGAAPIVARPIQPAAVLGATVERFRHTAERAGVTLSLDLPPALPEIRADPERLDQALGNLVQNALKFTPAGGSVTVSATVAAEALRITVADTGRGIDAADLPRIFERFYVADRARANGGTGLGLAIVKHVVLAHGGTVEVESTPERGSAFTVSLPLALSL